MDHFALEVYIFSVEITFYMVLRSI